MDLPMTLVNLGPSDPSRSLALSRKTPLPILAPPPAPCP